MEQGMWTEYTCRSWPRDPLNSFTDLDSKTGYEANYIVCCMHQKVLYTMYSVFRRGPVCRPPRQCGIYRHSSVALCCTATTIHGLPICGDQEHAIMHIHGASPLSQLSWNVSVPVRKIIPNILEGKSWHLLRTCHVHSSPAGEDVFPVQLQSHPKWSC